MNLGVVVFVYIYSAHHYNYYLGVWAKEETIAKGNIKGSPQNVFTEELIHVHGVHYYDVGTIKVDLARRHLITLCMFFG